MSADGDRWFLLNASPDVHAQLGTLPRGKPAGIRHVPVEGVVLTDAELDHTLGVLLLREGRQLQLYATDAVRGIVENDSRIVPVAGAFAEVAVRRLPVGGTVPLTYRDGSPSGITVETFAVPAGPPRFASGDHPGHTIGLLLREDGGGTCAFVPGCGALDDDLVGRLAVADLVLFDGTFWTDDELISLGIGDRTARQMDHLPVCGEGGSLEYLSRLPGQHRVYTHINNTNPMLVEDSAERREVERRGLTVGADGMQFTL